jgi:hypothetical protein
LTGVLPEALRRSLAAVVGLLAAVPLWHLLSDSSTGLAGAATVAQASAHSTVLWSGLLLCALPGLLIAMLADRDALESRLRPVLAPLGRPTTRVFTLVLSAGAALLAMLIAHAVMGGLPTLIDSFAQLVHARYLATGAAAGPVNQNSEFWHIQQTLLTQHGWVSQYPPGHVLLLALGLKLGIVSLIGPLCWGIAVCFTTLTLHALLPNLLLARLAALLAALSPFSLVMSGAFMSHIPAAACAAAALYFIVQAQGGKWWHAALAGAALGALFTMRPLTAVALGAVAFGAALSSRRAVSALIGAAAALPMVIAVAAHNHHYFGAATRFGYEAALGPAAGLGFGVDPWGNRYGLLQALAYTSAELMALSLYLFEVPLPLVLLVGVYFATGKRAASEWLLFAWCLAPVVANLFYWHHGLFMGPRMLADVGIFWAALAVISVVGLARGLRARTRVAVRYSPRTFALATVLAAGLFGAILLLPERLSSYRLTPERRALLQAPAVDGPALVFVHGGWTTRIGMRLAAHGMRLDSVETALRQNSTCLVHAFADSFVGGGKAAIRLDFAPRADELPPVTEISPGNRMRVVANERMTASCAAQINADRAGVIDVTPFIWQGDLPGMSARRALFVRDMGPQANQRLIHEHPNRRALMLIPHDQRVALVPYTIAEREIWKRTGK